MSASLQAVACGRKAVAPDALLIDNMREETQKYAEKDSAHLRPQSPSKTA